MMVLKMRRGVMMICKFTALAEFQSKMEGVQTRNDETVLLIKE